MSYSVRKDWSYWKDQAGQGRFLAFVSNQGSCSMRIFDATSGTFLLIDRRKGIPDYEKGFTKHWKSTVSLLNIPWRVQTW